MVTFITHLTCLPLKTNARTLSHLLLVAVAFGLCSCCDAFISPTTRSAFLPQKYHIASESVSNLRMCICIDCKWVTSCKAYHFVETRHEQPHMTETPDFEPREGSPTIHVNIRTEQQQSRGDEEAMEWTLNSETSYEYDVVACADYAEDLGCWVRNMPEEIRIANPDFVPT